MNPCYFHSTKESAYTCPLCQKHVCSSCAILVEGAPYCQMCWDGLVAKMEEQLVREEAVESFPIPWQRRRELGTMTAFVQTASQVAFHPSRFFALLPTGRDLFSPLIFAVICILLFWYPMNLFYIKVLLPAIVEQSQTLSAELQSSPFFNQEAYEKITQSLSAFDIIMMPFSYLVFQLFLTSWLQQALVALFQGKQGYEATFQIRCYATIMQCLNLIPIIGIVLAEIGSLVLCTRGFQVVQRLPLFPAFLIAAVPVLLTLLPNFLALL